MSRQAMSKSSLPSWGCTHRCGREALRQGTGGPRRAIPALCGRRDVFVRWSAPSFTQPSRKSRSAKSSSSIRAPPARGYWGECVGFLNEEAVLSPIGELQGVSGLTEVGRTGRVEMIGVGPGLRDRFARTASAISGRQGIRSLAAETSRPAIRSRPAAAPLSASSSSIRCARHARHRRPPDCGARPAIGIFGEPGVRQVDLARSSCGAPRPSRGAALIGERGREVREFIERQLGPEGRAKSVAWSRPRTVRPWSASRQPMRRPAIAEYFRDQGRTCCC